MGPSCNLLASSSTSNASLFTERFGCGSLSPYPARSYCRTYISSSWIKSWKQKTESAKWKYGIQVPKVYERQSPPLFCPSTTISPSKDRRKLLPMSQLECLRSVVVLNMKVQKFQTSTIERSLTLKLRKFYLIFNRIAGTNKLGHNIHSSYKMNTINIEL